MPIISKKFSYDTATHFLAAFKSALPIARRNTIIAAGSYRRGKSFLGDLDIISFRPLEPLIAIMNSKKMSDGAGIHIKKVLVSGPLHASFEIKYKQISFQLDIFYAPPTECATSLLHWTGSKNFNIIMRAKAKRLGYKLSQHGLFDAKTGRRVAGLLTERAVFKKLNIPYKAPAAREL